MLYTTHYMEEAERLCDRVGIIDEGELRAEGTRRELVSLVGERDRLLDSFVATTVGALASVREVYVDGSIDVVVDDAASTLRACRRRRHPGSRDRHGMQARLTEPRGGVPCTTGTALRYGSD